MKTPTNESLDKRVKSLEKKKTEDLVKKLVKELKTELT